MAGTIHDEQYYTISKGKLLFQQNGVGGYEDLGNITELKITEEVEKKEHYESRTKAAKRDDVTGIRTKAGGSFILDSIHKDNLEKWFLGDKTETTQSSATASTFNIASMEAGKWYEIDEKVNVSNLEVKDSTETATYTEGTDYEINYEAGLIMAIPGGGISDNDEIHITSFDVAETKITTINSAKYTDKRGRVLFIADPLKGEINDIKGYATIIPSGEYSVIGEDYIQISFDIDFIAHVDYKPGLFNVRRRGNTAD
jgi:hypothetical protein